MLLSEMYVECVQGLVRQVPLALLSMISSTEFLAPQRTLDIGHAGERARVKMIEWPFRTRTNESIDPAVHTMLDIEFQSESIPNENQNINSLQRMLQPKFMRIYFIVYVTPSIHCVSLPPRGYDDNIFIR